jgi:ribulose kinase
LRCNGQVPISLTAVPDAVALGSAICTAVGAGAFPDLRAAGRAMIHLTTTVEPGPSTRQVYNEGYIRYKETYAALAPLDPALLSRLVCLV